jgi:hypothetical protein
MALNSHYHEGNSNATAPVAGKNATRNSNSTLSNSTSNATVAQVANTTNVVGALSTSDVIINKAPYEVTKCEQVIMLKAKRIADFDDYTTRAPAFFTMSAYLINMFESQDNNKLLESINLAHIKIIPSVLEGSKTCLGFQDGVNYRNISLCIDDQETFDAILKSYNSFMTCRMGGDLKEFDPVVINQVLQASCNGFNSTTGTNFDLPKIKSQMASELRAAGFNVDDGQAGPKMGFGLNNATANGNSTSSAGGVAVSAPIRKVDMRVPGTY